MVAFYHTGHSISKKLAFKLRFDKLLIIFRCFFTAVIASILNPQEISMNSQKDGEQTPLSGGTGVLNKVWSFFSSTKLALILIFTITGFSLLGAFFVNINVFHSWWFLTAGALLMLNILVCSLNRWRSIRHILSGGPVKLAENFYTSGNMQKDVGVVRLSTAETVRLQEDILHRQGYRVRIEKDNTNTFIAADKNRFFKLGTYLSHLSLILFVLAYILGGFLGFQENEFILPEGNTGNVGHNTGISLQLISFTDEYYTDNTPKDYRSQVILYDGGQKVQETTIRVNHPLIYEGVRFYQAFFGPAVKIQVSRDGNIIYHGNVALSDTSHLQDGQFYAGYFDLPGTGLFVRLIGPAASVTDSMIPAGQIAVDLRDANNQLALKLVQKNTPITINGLEFTYEADAKFSGFQVSRDPTNAFIWVSCVLFILGIMLVLYFPHRQVWLLVQQLPQNSSRVLIRMGAGRGYNNTAELNQIVNQIEKELPAVKTKKTGGRGK
jgi:cytochrome c biogenesis protein